MRAYRHSLNLPDEAAYFATRENLSPEFFLDEEDMRMNRTAELVREVARERKVASSRPGFSREK